MRGFVGAGFKPALPRAMRGVRRDGAPSLRAAERSTYVAVKPARQSSAGSVTYVSAYTTIIYTKSISQRAIFVN
ncbi:MAG: hypothetical protein LBM98_12095 [Oscillospiraceae bacterium]|nr:hypothetical protein [Oscillospiraceae bacterium]